MEETIFTYTLAEVKTEIVIELSKKHQFPQEEIEFDENVDSPYRELITKQMAAREFVANGGDYRSPSRIKSMRMSSNGNKVMVKVLHS